ncbi:MAG: cation:proton antiporter [Bacillota bacterium]
MTVFSQSLGIAVVLLIGLAGGLLVRKIKMPMVAGYIIMGIFLGPSFLHIIPTQLNNELEIVKVLGLGVIALMIGSELEIKKIKTLAKAIFGITIVQFSGALICVFLAMYYLLHLPLTTSLLIAALAPATAPASPVAVIREYKAKGPLTRTLLGVVALDDAACIIVFGVIVSLVAIIFKGDTMAFNTLLEPFKEVFYSLLIGLLSGFLLVSVLRFIKNQHQVLVVLLGFVLLNSGIAYSFDLSPLLINMMAGFISVNIIDNPEPFQFLEQIELPLFIMLFTLTGATLQFDVLLDNWVLILACVISRGIGKVGGTFLGAKLSGADEMVQKYLGFAMFSKAGVTIGLLLVIQARFPEVAPLITAVVLGHVTIAELIGPVGTRFALISSGEANR